MDAETLAAYERSAAERCARYRLIVPTELRQFAQSFFHPGQPTADIGCGGGRDVAWLNQHDFLAVGYDASPAMLAEARLADPGIDVRAESLPALASIPDAAYANVLCAATLMHLPAEELPGAVAALARILRAGGRLLLSARTSATGDPREADGRLFTPLSADLLGQLLAGAGLAVLQVRHEADHYRPGVRWLTVLAERGP
jgi:SAM-dependent methyltransferase